MITQNRVKELFDYHKDGHLVWKINNGIRSKIGNIAGTKKITKFNRYFVIRIDNKNYLLHRVIFLWNHGYMPENGVDHIDQNRTNNRIENLREVSHQCNTRNRRTQSNNTSGVCGVYFHKLTHKWEASIAENGKLTHLGIFENFDDAVKARWEKEVELNWHGCNSTSSAYLYLHNKLNLKTSEDIMAAKKTDKKKETKKAEKVKRDCITKSNIIESIADMQDLSKAKAKELVDSVFETIADALNEGVEVAIDKFGKFNIKDKPERSARNPKTGETITVAARTAVAFKPSVTLKKSVNGE